MGRWSRREESGGLAGGYEPRSIWHGPGLLSRHTFAGISSRDRADSRRIFLLFWVLHAEVFLRYSPDYSFQEL